MADVTVNTNQAVSATTDVAQQPKSTRKAPGLQFKRYFTKLGVSPYDEVEWELRTASINDAAGNVLFEQKDVEVPKDWSMTATNIVASKYLHGKLGTSERPASASSSGVSPRPSATGA
jgi:ribonucleoside-diphosphate reductase alpha chain